MLHNGFFSSLSFKAALHWTMACSINIIAPNVGVFFCLRARSSSCALTSIFLSFSSSVIYSFLNSSYSIPDPLSSLKLAAWSLWLYLQLWLEVLVGFFQPRPITFFTFFNWCFGFWSDIKNVITIKFNFTWTITVFTFFFFCFHIGSHMSFLFFFILYCRLLTVKLVAFGRSHPKLFLTLSRIASKTNWPQLHIRIILKCPDPRSNTHHSRLFLTSILDQGSVIATVPILILSQVYTVVHWSQALQPRFLRIGPGISSGCW